jgi:protein-disulfide isomerase
VYASDGAYFLGVPVASFGLFFYITVAVLALVGALNKRVLGASATVVAWVLALLAVLVSLYKATQLIQMGYLCIYCVSMYAVNLGLLIVLFLALVREGGFGDYLKGFFGSLGQQAEGFSYKPSLAVPLVLTALVYGFGFLASKNYEKKQSEIVDAGNTEAAILQNVTTHFAQEPIKVQIAADTPMEGNKDAKVTIHEFADFQCPACAQASLRIRELMKDYSKYIKVYYQHYPLDNTINPVLKNQIHVNAGMAAKAGVCANAKGKFWEFANNVFDHQDALSKEMVVKTASDYGMDATEFTACMEAPETTQKVKDDLARGKAAGVSSTPSLYVNGRLVDQWDKIDILKRIVQEELRRADVKK